MKRYKEESPEIIQDNLQVNIMDFAGVEISESAVFFDEYNLIEADNRTDKTDEDNNETNEVDEIEKTNEETDKKFRETVEVDKIEALIDKETLIDEGPYFQNFTSAVLYILSTKHTITTSAYEDLAKIVKHSEFCAQDVVTNIRSIHKWRYRLSLVKVCQHDVPICKQRTPSMAAFIKKAFTISPLEHLKHILNNPKILSKLYFGPGVINKSKCEFWHRDI
ncbi:3505_t:CDS:2 [Cetraspora pellucida]|uniref:3505_t:CDS:1 n=1 Tax=Cetraspora pellucida TaxID=1433469 RepID=A0ACA9MWC8_9GLOM|nr:3505_t:CDS:2 [Cetraspora pellucida]